MLFWRRLIFFKNSEYDQELPRHELVSIFVSPVYTIKHILQLKYIRKYTTAILKEL